MWTAFARSRPDGFGDRYASDDKKVAACRRFQALLKQHWVIERTFDWPSRNHRLAKGSKRLVDASTATVVIAVIQLLARRHV
jgi:hypothetical protein